MCVCAASRANRIESTRETARTRTHAHTGLVCTWLCSQALCQSVIKNHWFAPNWRGGKRRELKYLLLLLGSNGSWRKLKKCHSQEPHAMVRGWQSEKATKRNGSETHKHTNSKKQRIAFKLDRCKMDSVG